MSEKAGDRLWDQGTVGNFEEGSIPDTDTDAEPRKKRNEQRLCFSSGIR